MLYPEVNIDTWLEKYPSLRKALPAECLCGRAVTTLKPYYAKNSLGITSGPCECGRERPFSASLLRGPIRDEFLKAMEIL